MPVETGTLSTEREKAWIPDRYCAENDNIGKIQETCICERLRR